MAVQAEWNGRIPTMSTAGASRVTPPAATKRLLIVDDDQPLLNRLARAMERRGFEVRTADSVAAGVAAAQEQAPDYAVGDLRLADGSGLDVVQALRSVQAATPLGMLPGYGAI